MVRALALALLALLVTAGWLGQARSPTIAWLFLLGALPVWMVVAIILRVFARQEGHRGGALGVATQVTLARGWLLSALAGFVPVALAAPEQAALGTVALLPGLLYTIAALGDLVDGYLARRRGEETALGARLDVAFDALGLVVGPLAAIALGRLPAFYLLLGATYYLFHGGLWWRRRHGQPVYLERLVASRITRMYAGYQMGLVATVLFPVVGPPGTTLAAALFMLPSLTLFTRDWLVTTGRLDARDPGYTRVLAVGQRFIWNGMPVVRLLAAAGIAALVIEGQVPGVLLALGAALLLGVTTRLTAFIAAVPLIDLLEREPSTLLWATILVTLVCLLGGGGRAALLREDRVLLARAGERPNATP